MILYGTAGIFCFYAIPLDIHIFCDKWEHKRICIFVSSRYLVLKLSSVIQNNNNQSH